MMFFPFVCYLIVLEARATNSTIQAPRDDYFPRRLDDYTHNFGEAKCVAKVLPCARLGKDCRRPRSVFVMKIRGSGGKSFGEGVLNHLFERQQMIVSEGWSTAHLLTQSKLQNLQAEGSVCRITILRHPIARIMSRYWFEGRWPLFSKVRCILRAVFSQFSVLGLFGL
jgi:hypothetical protein